MNKQTRILFGITTQSHTEIGLDEMYGLQSLGYFCDWSVYGGKKGLKSPIKKFYILLSNAIKLLIKSYQFRPNFIYLNSRLEFIASKRDFITILFLKIFYYRKVEFLIKSHGSDLEVLKTQRFFYSKIIFPYLKHYVKGWLFLSTEEVTWITSNELLDKNKIFLTKNIVRFEKFQIDKDFKLKLNIPANYKILLFIGRLIKEKGIHYVVNAFAQIRNEFKVVLIIVGDGEEFEKIKARINLLNIKADIILTGWVEEAKATYFISNSDLLIFPTFCSEGFPMVLFNSMASGLSIITTKTRAAVDYLKEPENCLWVEPKSNISIQLALKKLLNDEHLSKQMQQNNKKKSHLFSQNVVAKELSSIINLIEK